MLLDLANAESLAVSDRPGWRVCASRRRASTWTAWRSGAWCVPPAWVGVASSPWPDLMSQLPSSRCRSLPEEIPGSCPSGSCAPLGVPAVASRLAPCEGGSIKGLPGAFRREEAPWPGCATCCGIRPALDRSSESSQRYSIFRRVGRAIHLAERRGGAGGLRHELQRPRYGG